MSQQTYTSESIMKAIIPFLMFDAKHYVTELTPSSDFGVTCNIYSVNNRLFIVRMGYCDNVDFSLEVFRADEKSDINVFDFAEKQDCTYWDCHVYQYLSILNVSGDRTNWAVVLCITFAVVFLISFSVLNGFIFKSKKKSKTK